MKRLMFLVMIIVVTFMGTTYSHDDVPEATSGFRQPLDAWHYNGGYEFNDWSTDSDCYHPGTDYNGYPYSGDGDLYTDVLAVANGKVVSIETDDAFGLCMTIEHHYFGDTVFSQYGHLYSTEVSVGANVSKGDHIAELGKSGTTFAHLHWEIRKGKTAEHPNGHLADYWCFRTPTLM